MQEQNNISNINNTPDAYGMPGMNNVQNSNAMLGSNSMQNSNAMLGMNNITDSYGEPEMNNMPNSNGKQGMNNMQNPNEKRDMNNMPNPNSIQGMNGMYSVNGMVNMFQSFAGNALVEMSAVVKGYGKKTVFTNLNLNIPSGRIIGLLGPNGSGKTTIIKMLAGLLTQDSGNIRIGGMPIGAETKAIVSYLPERTYLNEELKVSQIIELFSMFYSDFDVVRANHMLQLLAIDPNAVVKKLSKGNKEKVQLIMVMSRRAKLYLLDEPIAGVDPAARDYILQTIISNYEPNATILISTHLIADVESVLDDVIFVRYGQIIAYRNADDLRSETGKSIDETFREAFKCW